MTLFVALERLLARGCEVFQSVRSVLVCMPGSELGAVSQAVQELRPFGSLVAVRWSGSLSSLCFSRFVGERRAMEGS